MIGLSRIGWPTRLRQISPVDHVVVGVPEAWRQYVGSVSPFRYSFSQFLEFRLWHPCTSSVSGSSLASGEHCLGLLTLRLCSIVGLNSLHYFIVLHYFIYYLSGYQHERNCNRNTMLCYLGHTTSPLHIDAFFHMHYKIMTGSHWWSIAAVGLNHCSWSHLEYLAMVWLEEP